MYKFSLIIFFVFVQLGSVMTQWQPDVRLTNDPAVSRKAYNGARSITSNGNILHVAWYDNRDGNFEIYYKRSTDAGINWGADTRLTNSVLSSDYPSIAVYGTIVHIVWQDNRNGNPNHEIYYKRSTDSGLTWGSDIRLTNNQGYSTIPSLCLSGSTLHLVWQDDRDDIYGEIYYKKSTDSGSTWSADLRLTNNIAETFQPSVSCFGSNIHIVWADKRDGNFEIYYKNSTDGGANWSSDIRLTNNTAYSWYPSIGVSNSNIHVVWADSRNGSGYEIYYKRSTNGGLSWTSDMGLTNYTDDSEFPSIDVSGATLHIVWTDRRDTNYEVYYKKSVDGGINWDLDTRLTNTFFYSEFPSITISGSMLNVVWQEGTEIYYKRNPTGNPIGIHPITSEIPNNFSLFQNYPNPFNPATKIRFALPKSSFVVIIIYDALGRELETIVNEQLNAGTYEAYWNADKFSSGVYYYKLSAGDFMETKKMILIK